jgi:hypothetical protein
MNSVVNVVNGAYPDVGFVTVMMTARMDLMNYFARLDSAVIVNSDAPAADET